MVTNSVLLIVTKLYYPIQSIASEDVLHSFCVSFLLFYPYVILDKQYSVDYRLYVTQRHESIHSVGVYRVNSIYNSYWYPKMGTDSALGERALWTKRAI